MASLFHRDQGQWMLTASLFHHDQSQLTQMEGLFLQ